MPVRILMIDDSDVVLAWAKAKLEARGFEVLTYNQSLGIQAFIARTQPQLVLLDVNMRALNGDVACKMVKQNPKTKDVCVALYSTVSEDAARSLVAAAGADGYVQKTEDVDWLVAQISKVLAKRMTR